MMRTTPLSSFLKVQVLSTVVTLPSLSVIEALPMAGRVSAEP